MTRVSAERMPWRDSDLTAVIGTGLIGLIAILLGWFAGSGSPAPARQMLWLSIAVVGLAIFAVGNCMWLMRLRRAVGERRAELVSFEVDEDEVDDEIAVVPRRAAATWVRAVGMARVHRPDCPMVAGKHAEPAHPRDGKLCGVCADG